MEDEVISVVDIFRALKSKWRVIAMVTIVTTIISIMYSYFLVTPIYTANVKIFVGKGANVKNEYNVNDVELYKNLIKTYSEMVKTDDLLQNAINKNNLGLSVSTLASGIVVTQGQDTQIMTIQYSNYNNKKTKEILDAVTNEFIAKTKELVPNGKAKILQNSQYPKAPSNLNSKKNIAIGIFAGLLFGCGIVVLIEYFNNTLRSKVQIENMVNIPVIGVIPKE